MSSTLRTLVEAFARGPRALDEAAACFSEDAVYREPHKPAVHGRAAIALHFAAYAAAPVAWRFLLDEVIEDGARACVVYRFAVREGEEAAWSERGGCAIVRVDERGQIALWREYEG
ncbi:MAG TPA: nuclear transport factor 2 family protein [Candidatus Sulfotelmatobacter sp.]|nr:nuclear transport factor 2 family protein [Candidatus Sulfotelmatobacter sp.]